MSRYIGPTILAFCLASIFGVSAKAQSDIQPTDPNGAVSVTFEFDVKPGFEREFENVFRTSIKCARLDPANIAFNIHSVVGQERKYVAFIVWRSPIAFESHLKRPYTRQLLAMFDRALARPISETRRYIRNLEPATSFLTVTGDPADKPECR